MWQDVIGHKKEIGQLIRAAEEGQLAHAYLFTGPDGVGKRLVAKEFATALVCSKGPSSICGACAGCTKAMTKNHPDIMYLEVEEGRNQIRIGEVRSIQRRIIHSPLEGSYKTVIVNDADLLNEEASNALLKTLEEPPDATFFFLISSRPHMLLPTIRSRCQEITFSPLGVKEVCAHIQRLKNFSEEDALLIAHLSQGSLGMAISFPNEAISEISERIRNLFKNPSAEMILATAEDWTKDGERLGYIVQILNGWFRDILIFKSTSNDKKILNTKFAEVIKKASAGLSEKDLFKMLEDIREAEKAENTTYNKQLMFENLLFSLFPKPL